MDLDELDIYDDLDTFQKEEEKKSGELLTLEAKYNESLKANDVLQAENADLKKQIKRIGINFQNLLDTAKAEIKRKDKQIEQLRKEKDDICFRRKQPRSEYREVAATTYAIDNWNKNEHVFPPHDYNMEVEAVVNPKTTLHAGHARDPRMRAENQKYAQRDEKSDRKHDIDTNRIKNLQHNAHGDQQESKYGTHSRDREDSWRSATRDNRYDSRALERGRKEESERRGERDRREERGRREERKCREDHDRRNTRNCSSEKEKHMYNSKHEDNGGRRQHSHEKIGDRKRHGNKDDKSRSNIPEGSRERRNDYKNTHEDAHLRSKDANDKPHDKVSKNNNWTKNSDDINHHQDTRVKSSKDVESKGEKVKYIEEAVQLSKDDKHDSSSNKFKSIQTIKTNKNNDFLCNKLPSDRDTHELNEKSITKNGSLTKEKLLALEEQFNGTDIGTNSNCKFANGGMNTPKKAALFDSIFGSTPSNAESVSNTLLTNAMVLLKNSSSSATTSPSNYTDTSEQHIPHSTKTNLKKSDIDECFVLNSDKNINVELNMQQKQNENFDTKRGNKIQNENKDKSATIILLSDDEDEIDVIAVNEAICDKKSIIQGLPSIEPVGGTNKGEIKILENIRLPNIYELRAQQRLLREEAAKNVKNNKIDMVKYEAMPRLVKTATEIGMGGKAKEVKTKTGNLQIATQDTKDPDRQDCKAETNINHLDTLSTDVSNISSAVLSEKALSARNENEIKMTPCIDKINLIAEKGVAFSNQNLNTENVIETKDAKNAKANAIEAIKQKSNNLPIEEQSTMEEPIKPDALKPSESGLSESNWQVSLSELPASINKTASDAVMLNQANSDFTDEIDLLKLINAMPEKHLEERELNQLQITTNSEHKNSQISGNDEKTEMEVDLTVEVVEEIVANEGQFADTTTTTTNNTIVPECHKSEHKIMEIASSMETDIQASDKQIFYNSNDSKKDKLVPKDTILNQHCIVELSDDEEINTEAHVETVTQIKKIPETLTSKDESSAGSYNKNGNNDNNNSTDKVTNEEKLAEERKEGDEQKLEPATEMERKDEKEGAEKTIKAELKSAETTNICLHSFKKERNNNESSAIIYLESSKLNGTHPEENVEGSISFEVPCKEDNLNLNIIELPDTKIVEDKTINTSAVEQFDFDVQTRMEESKISDVKKAAIANHENSKLEDNKTQNTNNVAEQELEDAVAYLVNVMDVELRSEVYEKQIMESQQVNQVLENSKQNKYDASEDNGDQSSNDKSKELEKSADPDVSKHGNIEVSQNTNLKLPESEDVKLLKNRNLKLSSNSDLQISKNADLELLKNASLSNSEDLKFSKNRNSKVSSNSDTLLSQNANIELSKNANPNLPSSSYIFSSDRNALVDSMKRSEVLWKFKIPKISAKRKREDNDETTKEKYSAANGELTEKSATNSAIINEKVKEDKLRQQQQKPQQEISLHKKKSKKEEKRFEDQKLYLMQDEIEIVEITDDIDRELIETRLLTEQTPEEKRTLSAEREKSERIIKEIDNWARRKVGEIPDIIENSLIMENKEDVKVEESIKEIPKSSEKSENKNAEEAKDERKTDKITKGQQLEQKTEVKTTTKSIGEKAYAPLLKLNLCELQEKENEKQLANRAAGTCSEDLKSGQLGHSPNKRGKYESSTDKKMSEAHTKLKTETHKRGKEKKNETKSQKVSSNKAADNIKGKVEGIEMHQNRQSGEHEATNKSDEVKAEENPKQAVKDESFTKCEENVAKTMNDNSSLEVKGQLGVKEPETEMVYATVIENLEKTEVSPSLSKELEDNVKKSREKGSANLSVKDANDIPKHNELKGKDRNAGGGLKRAGGENKSKVSSMDTEEVVKQQKRAKLELDAKKRENAQKTSEIYNEQVPLAQNKTKAATNITTASLTKSTTNHSTAAASSNIDKKDETKLTTNAQKRYKSDTASDNDDNDELMPKSRKRKRCEMRIEDSDEDECRETTMPNKKSTHIIREADTTAKKDILAILQNDSVNGNGNESSSGGSIFPAPETPSSLPIDISQDEQYREIDSRMQLMFASPKVTDKTSASKNVYAKLAVDMDVAIKEPEQQPVVVTTGRSLEQVAAHSSLLNSLTSSPALIAHTPHTLDFNVSDTSISDFNSNSFQVSSRNITIDETHDNEEMDTSMNSSALSDSSLCTKHISLGSSDYRFEKVSDNVVNLFITRKSRGRRKPIAAAVVVQPTTTTTTNNNTIKTVT